MRSTGPVTSRGRVALLLGLLLVPNTTAAEPIDAALLLRLYTDSLAAEPPPADVERVAADLERLSAEMLPAVRLRQRANWTFGGGLQEGSTQLGVGASVALPLVDPDARLQRELGAWRLLLTRHNAEVERGDRLVEFRRSLRLLAHAEEVEAVLGSHREALLHYSPGWADLESSTAPAARAGPQEIAFLEVTRALRRARAERRLLAELVGWRLGMPAGALLEGSVGRPLPPVTMAERSEDPAATRRADRSGATTGPGPLQLTACLANDPEMVRAELLLGEARAAEAARGARERLRIALDLSGDVSYLPQPASGLPRSTEWTTEVRISLRVTMPSLGQMSGSASVDLTPMGLSQEFSFGWPATGFPSPPDPVADAEENYRRALADARLAVLRAATALDDARAAVRIRKLALGGAEAALARAGERVDAGLLDAVAQARIGLLNAELEFDLAGLELAASCGVA